jgi:hypothetical protein
VDRPKAHAYCDLERFWLRQGRAPGLNASFNESLGAHTWLNWRDHLTDFTPPLFQWDRRRSGSPGNPTTREL